MITSQDAAHLLGAAEAVASASKRFSAEGYGQVAQKLSDGAGHILDAANTLAAQIDAYNRAAMSDDVEGLWR